MELYVEKEFLDNFCIEFDKENPSQGQKILASIFEEYGEVEWYIDAEINTPEDFEILEMNYYFFAKRSDYKAPIGVSSLKEELFAKSKFQQTLVFTASEHDWFEQAEAKGALCFSYNNYESKIESIITHCHFKVDLSSKFESWDIFNPLSKISFNEIILNDNYILTHKFLMDKNIIAVLKQLLTNKIQEISLKIFTKELDVPKDLSQEEFSNQIQKTVHDRYIKLNSGLANFNKDIRIINNDLDRKAMIFHDRILLSNFFSIDSGVGFNLLPARVSNSQIQVETIFNKYTYKRINNLNKACNNYVKSLSKKKNETFTIYPN